MAEQQTIATKDVQFSDVVTKPAPDRVKKLVALHRRRHKSLLTERNPWVTDWRELAEHFQPRKFRALDEGDRTNEPGLADTLVDNTSVRGMRVLAAGMQGGMTSPARPWFRLGTPDTKLEDNAAVSEWLYEVQRRMLTVLSRSNFYDSIHQHYAELGTFGSGCIFMEKDPDTIINFKTLTAGEYCLITNPNGRVVGVFRLFSMTAEQLVDRFGKDKCSSAVQTAYNKPGTKDKWFEVVHVVMPNSDRDPVRADDAGMAYTSVYYEHKKSAKDPGEEPLAWGGFRQQPFAAPRWDVTGNDIYGRCPAMDTLPDVRQLQTMVSTMLKALHKQVDPPVVAPTDFHNVRTVPGAINNIDTVRGEGLRSLYDVKPEVQGTMVAIDAIKDDIREGLYNDLFKMLALSDRRTMTATEVSERIEEKLIMLGPVIERLHAELLDVIIDRVFAICLEAGILPPPPPELEGMDLKVEYISLLAQAQKMIGTSAIDQFLSLIGTYAEMFPEMADIPDVDEVGEQYAEMLGVPPTLLRPREEREAIREARTQAIAAQQQNEAMAQAGSTMKDMGSVDMEGDNALKALTGGLVQGGGPAL